MKKLRRDCSDLFGLASCCLSTTVPGRSLIRLVMMSWAIVALASNLACSGQSSATTIPTHVPYTRVPSPTFAPAPTDTPSPVSTDTPSPIPTNTPKPSATHVPTRTTAGIDTLAATGGPARQPITPVSPTPTGSFAPVLLEPGSGRSYGGNTTFSWQWYRSLSDEGPYGGEYFALRVWHEDDERKSITWMKETSYVVSLDDYGGRAGRYLWNVAVVRQTGEPRDTNWECVVESDIHWFVVQQPDLPTPTPTPKPKDGKDKKTPGPKPP